MWHSGISQGHTSLHAPMELRKTKEPGSPATSMKGVPSRYEVSIDFSEALNNHWQAYQLADVLNYIIHYDCRLMPTEARAAG